MSKIPIYNMILRNFFQYFCYSVFYKFCTLIFVIHFLFGIDIVFAQKITYPKHQIGIGYSSFSGTGINYQIELNTSSALQFSGIGYYFGDDPPDNLDFYGIIGGEYQYTITKQRDLRYYGFAGISLLHLERRRLSSEVINDKLIIYKSILTNRIYNFGFGIGAEYKIDPRIAISANLGILHQISDIADFSEYWDRNPFGTEFTGIGIGIGLRYAF